MPAGKPIEKNMEIPAGPVIMNESRSTLLGRTRLPAGPDRRDRDPCDVRLVLSGGCHSVPDIRLGDLERICGMAHDRGAARIRLGAVISAVLNLADRVRIGRLLLASALVACVSTACVPLLSQGLSTGLPLRFVTGIALAGVYPPGAKLVASWFAGVARTGDGHSPCRADTRFGSAPPGGGTG